MPGTIEPSKEKRHCGADDCNEQLVGTSIGHHYRSRTDFDKLKVLRNLPRQLAEEELKNLDPHTAYMFRHNHSATNLPHWRTHKPVAKPIPITFQRADQNDNNQEEEEEGEESEAEAEGDPEAGGDIVEELPDKRARLDNEERESLSDDGEEAETEDGVRELMQQVKEALMQRGGLDDDLMEELGEKIAQKVALKTAELLKAENGEGDRIALKAAQKTVELLKSEDEKADKASFEESWISGDSTILCRPCLKFADLDDVPKKLSQHRRGTFGIIERKDSEGNLQSKKVLNRSMKRHLENGLHLYCCERETKEAKLEKDFAEENKSAARIVTRNAIHTLKRGGSAVDFQAVNNLFHLESERQEIVVATKNSSNDAFFKIRDIVFNIVTEDIKEWFRRRGEGEVEEISATLDKVTVQRVSYTVLLTYFFSEGKIHVLLNSLMVMKSSEYDSEGTARAVVRELAETLGIGRIRLGEILLHFAYDGVYARTEERVGGGGSLNLTKYVALELGLEDGDLTGTWDAGHQLQIIWSKGLKANPKILEVVQTVFEAMSDFSLGKSATIFTERAKDLKCLVLTPKNEQKTRWVRATLRGIGTAMVNLAAMCKILEESFEEAVASFNHTAAKELERKIKKLKHPKTLLKIVGLCMLLEIYAGTSLEVQGAGRFPSQVWRRIKKDQQALKELAEKWKWGEQRLVKAGIEAPCAIVKRLKEEGKYEHKLLPSQVVRRQEEMRSTGLLPADQTLADLFQEEEPVIPLCGVVIMEEETTDDLLKEVERDLSKCAKSISSEWGRRHIQNPLQAAASSILGEDALEVFQLQGGSSVFQEEESEEEEEGASASSSAVKREWMSKLTKLIKALPGRQGQQFDPILIFPGLECWLYFLKENLKEEGQVKGEDEIYRSWFKKYVSCEDSLESNILFSKLFQNLQIRSCTEAIAETVGSIMNQHLGSNRYCFHDLRCDLVIINLLKNTTL